MGYAEYFLLIYLMAVFILIFEVRGMTVCHGKMKGTFCRLCCIESAGSRYVLCKVSGRATNEVKR